MNRPIPPLVPACLCLLLLSASCGDEAAGSAGASTGASTGTSGKAVGSVDARVADIRRALEAGLPDAAWTLLDQLEGTLGVEGPLLRARASLMEGDAIGALREIEIAKSLAGDDPDARVLATEVEVLVTLRRPATAEDALREAWKAVGRTAELERARGLLLISTPGGGAEGLLALQAALELDPGLPFVGFPLAQARLLVGRETLSTGAPEQALALAQAARGYDPEDPDFRELEADARSALMDFEGALLLYGGLEAEGRPMGDTLASLHQRYGTWLLMQKRRDEAADEYVLARELGLTDLGFGQTVLVDLAQEYIDVGIERYRAGDPEAAETLFRDALRYDPTNLEARNHLGVCFFQTERFAQAGEAWTDVLETARAEGIELPDPVHLNLARAWVAAGEGERARLALSDYLDRSPEGEWSDETRAFLAALEAERLREDG